MMGLDDDMPFEDKAGAALLHEVLGIADPVTRVGLMHEYIQRGLTQAASAAAIDDARTVAWMFLVKGWNDSRLLNRLGSEAYRSRIPKATLRDLALCRYVLQLRCDPAASGNGQSGPRTDAAEALLVDALAYIDHTLGREASA